MHEHIKKINVRFCKYSRQGLEVETGSTRSDGSHPPPPPIKRIGFSSAPPSFDSTVITLSRDKSTNLKKKLAFAGKNRQFLLFSQKDIIRQVNYFRFLLLSFPCFLTDYMIGRKALHFTNSLKPLLNLTAK